MMCHYYPCTLVKLLNITMKQLSTLGLAMLATVSLSTAQTAPQLSFVGRYESGIFGESAAEISAFDPATARLFVVNGAQDLVDVVSLSNPASPTLLFSIALIGNPNSVASYNGLIAIALEDTVKTNPGSVVFVDAAGSILNQVMVGALPDMLTFTPDGQFVLVANEGEPNSDYSIDPEGSVSIIDLRAGVAAASVSTVGFGDVDPATLDGSVRVFGPGATLAQDFEPEYIAVTDNSRLAYAVCQENNALVIIDILNARLLGVKGLGFKDHSLLGQGLDASDRDNIINIANWPVYGIPMPDGIAFAKSASGQGYILTANEGDARDYDTFSEESRMRDLTLDTVAFPDASDLRDNTRLGRLTLTTTLGDIDNDGEYEMLYSFGTRSFSVYDLQGNLVWDSGEDFEIITAAAYPDDFNATNDENGTFDNRSDNKGPEPEGITTGVFNGRNYAFIGLERIGGVMVYDVTDPAAPEFVQYFSSRDFSGDAELGTAGDLGPEGLAYIRPEDSPTGEALLVVSNEVSGTVAIFRFGNDCGLPQNLQVAFPGATTVAFDWDDVTGSLGYRLRLSRVGTTANKFLASPISQKVVSGFVPGASYNWAVRAACEEDTSAYSTVATFTVPAPRLALNANDQLQIQPNPVVDRVYLNGDVPAEGQASIFSTDGRLVAGPVYAAELLGGWDLRSLPSGAYLLQLDLPDGIQTTPLIKQ